MSSTWMLTENLLPVELLNAWIARRCWRGVHLGLQVVPSDLSVAGVSNIYIQQHKIKTSD